MEGDAAKISAAFDFDMPPILVLAILMILAAFVLTHFADDSRGRVRPGIAVWMMRLVFGGLILGALYVLFR